MDPCLSDPIISFAPPPPTATLAPHSAITLDVKPRRPAGRDHHPWLGLVGQASPTQGPRTAGPWTLSHFSATSNRGVPVARYSRAQASCLVERSIAWPS